MYNFKRITDYSYDIPHIAEIFCFAIISILFITLGIIAIRRFIINRDKLMVMTVCVMLVLFIVPQVFILRDMSLHYFKQYAIYEGQFKVVQSNTNETYAYDDDDYQKRIKVKDKNNNVQVFDIYNKTKYHKNELVKIKIRANKGYEPTLKDELPEYSFNSYVSMRSNQSLISIKKVK